MKIAKYIILSSITILFLFFQNFTTPTKIDIQRGFIDNDDESYINVEDFGVVGDGKTDDTLGLQKAVKYAFDNGVKRLIFRPKTYLLSMPKGQNTIVLYGENLTIVGNGATFIKSSETGGYWGDAFLVAGLIPTMAYPIIKYYSGLTMRPARNIVISDITIKHTTQIENMNCIGIANVNGVTLKNVTCENAPQSSFAIISYYNNRDGVRQTPASINVTLDGTHSVGSKKHAYRVISYAYDKEIHQQILNVTIKNCTSKGVKEAESNEKNSETLGHKINLWYRPAYNSAKLKVSNCSFDQSGKVLVSAALVGSLELSQNTIDGGLRIVNTNTSIKVENNKIRCTLPDMSSAIFLKGMLAENTFINNKLYNYVKGCVEVNASENFRDSPNQVILLQGGKS